MLIDIGPAEELLQRDLPTDPRLAGHRYAPRRSTATHHHAARLKWAPLTDWASGEPASRRPRPRSRGTPAGPARPPGRRRGPGAPEVGPVGRLRSTCAPGGSASPAGSRWPSSGPA